MRVPFIRSESVFLKESQRHSEAHYPRCSVDSNRQTTSTGLGALTIRRNQRLRQEKLKNLAPHKTQANSAGKGHVVFQLVRCVQHHHLSSLKAISAAPSRSDIATRWYCRLRGLQSAPAAHFWKYAAMLQVGKLLLQQVELVLLGRVVLLNETHHDCDRSSFVKRCECEPELPPHYSPRRECRRRPTPP
jgi:hypothetical protein